MQAKGLAFSEGHFLHYILQDFWSVRQRQLHVMKQYFQSLRRSSDNP
jgi:hypothetical protein